MIEGVITTPQVLTSNSSSLVFVDDLRTRRANCCGFLQHASNSPLYKITEGGIYEIEFNSTVTSATVGIVAIGLYQDGVLLPETTSAETISAAGNLADVSFNKKLRVCCNGGTTLSVASIPSVLAGNPLVATATQVPTITKATFSIKKIA